MHYAVLSQSEVDGQEQEVHEIEVEELRQGHYQVVLDGRQFAVEAQDLGDGQFRLLLDGQHLPVLVDQDSAWVGGGCYRGEVVDLRALALRQARAQAEAAGGSVAVTAPMAGKVAAILVAEGQEVAKGDGLVVIEAMKMENELRAPRPGTVRDLISHLGGAVNLGATLCRVE